MTQPPTPRDPTPIQGKVTSTLISRFPTEEELDQLMLELSTMDPAAFHLRWC